MIVPSAWEWVVCYTGFYSGDSNAQGNCQPQYIEASADSITLAKFVWDVKDQQYPHNGAADTYNTHYVAVGVLPRGFSATLPNATSAFGEFLFILLLWTLFVPFTLKFWEN